MLYVDRFTPTLERCDWAGYWAQYGSLSTGAYQFGWPRDAPLYPSEDCVDAVLADLNADGWALAAMDDLDDPYGLVRSEDDSTSVLGTLLLGARTMFLYDTGRIDELVPNALVSEVYIERLAHTAAETGVELHSAAQYNFVSSIVEAFVPSDCDRGAAYMTFSTRIVSLCWPFGSGNGPSAADTMVHEAYHHLSGAHVPCKGGGSGCDDDITGAYGASLAVLLEHAKRHPQSGTSQDDDAMDRVFMRMWEVNSFVDEEGHLDPIWWTYDAWDF